MLTSALCSIFISACTIAASDPNPPNAPATPPALATPPAPPTPAFVLPKIPDQLLTVAERSDFKATATHAEVVSLLSALQASSPLARVISMGKTTEGRDIPVLIMADPPISTPAAARERVKSGSLLILAFGNIHAGEVDGKEALPILARDILSTRADILKSTILCFAPIYNCDGNERISPTNRPGQVGPEQGMGVRENANGRDLNRDFVKLDEAETRALVGFMNQWDPHIIIDCHTTNGSYHRYVLTYAGPKVPAGNTALNTFARETFLPRIDLDFEARSGYDAFWYGSFEGAFTDAPRGYTRWETFPAEARYGTNYIGLRNRMSILSEAYAYAPFKDRVIATRDFVESIIHVALKEKSSLLKTLQNADNEMQAEWKARPIALRTTAVPQPGKVTILGYEEVMQDGRMHNTGRHKEITVDLVDRFEPTLSRQMPWAYAIPLDPATTPSRRVAMSTAIERLGLHGIDVTVLPRDVTADISQSRITSARSASREYQGHIAIKAEVTDERRILTLSSGTVLIPTQQRLGRLAAYLLEPECEDGLTTWNFFDPWMTAGELFPIVRIEQPIDLTAKPTTPAPTPSP